MFCWVLIGGTIASLGFSSGTLLTGDLTAFGFLNAGGDPLEFLFGVTGGDAASHFGPVVGIRLSNSGFTGTFASNFKNTGNGKNELAAPLRDPRARKPSANVDRARGPVWPAETVNIEEKYLLNR